MGRGSKWRNWLTLLLLIPVTGLSSPPREQASTPSWEACLQALQTSSEKNPGCEPTPSPLIDPILQTTLPIRTSSEDTRVATIWLNQIREAKDPNATLTSLLKRFRTDSTLSEGSISEFYQLSEHDATLRKRIQRTTEALRVAEALGAPFQIGSASHNLKTRLDYYSTRLDQMVDAGVPGMLFGKTQVLDRDSITKANQLREKIQAELPNHSVRTQDPEELLKRSENARKIAVEFLEFEKDVFEPKHFQLIHETIPEETEAQIEVLSWIKGVSVSGLGLVAQLKGGAWAGAGVHGVFCAFDRSYTEWMLGSTSANPRSNASLSDTITACVIEAGVGAGAGKATVKTFQIIEGSAARKLAQSALQAGAGITIGSSAAVISSSVQGLLLPNSASDSSASACDVFLRSLENEAERYTSLSGLTSLAAETLLHRKIHLASARAPSALKSEDSGTFDKSKPLLSVESKPLLPSESKPLLPSDLPAAEPIRTSESPAMERIPVPPQGSQTIEPPANKAPASSAKGPSKNQLAREQKERERKEREAAVAERKRQSFDSKRAESDSKKKDQEGAAENRRAEQEAARIAEIKNKSAAEEKLRAAEQNYKKDRTQESLDTYLSLQAEKLQLPFGGSNRSSIDWDERNSNLRPFFRFVPKVGKSGEILHQRTDAAEGFVDQWGLIWIKGPARTSGDAFEWDVQIPKGKFDSLPSEIKARAKDSGHLNVSIDGVITH